MISTQIWFGPLRPSEIRITKVVNKSPNKPRGGFWTSTYTPNKEYISDWHDQGESMFGTFDFKSCWILKPVENIKYCVIDSYDDLDKLWDQYNYQDHRFMDIGFDIGKMYTYPFDFESYFKDYDALQMTQQGQWKTRLTDPYNFYGWDSECVLWGSWKFKEVKSYGN